MRVIALLAFLGTAQGLAMKPKDNVEVYASLLQVEPHVPNPEAPTPKSNQPKGAEVVKR